MKKSKRLAIALAWSLFKVFVWTAYCLAIFGIGYSAYYHTLGFLIGCLAVLVGILTWMEYKEIK